MQNNLRIVFGLVCLFVANNLFAQTQEEVDSYIDKYKRLAIEEQIRSGVPAAITLAQGIHEATAGKSELATEANNHFGIKCKSTWTGMTYLHDDDAKQECFRKYSSAEQSYIDHSDFLKNNNRYHFLFDLEVTDYKGWASGLKRAGYATNPAYVKRLTDAIEKYNLQQYTYEGLNKSFATTGEVVPEKDKEPIKEVVKNVEPIKEVKSQVGETTYYKGLKGFYAKKGDMLLEKAMEYNIRYARLLQINELEDAPLPFDMFVFTEKKRKVGTVEFHQIQQGENLYMIAQKEALLLENLYIFNNLKEGQEPLVGENLNLQYKMVGTPKLKAKFLETLATKEEEKISTPEKVKEVAKVEVQKEEIKKVVVEEVQKPVEIEEVKTEVAKEVEVPVLSDEELKKMETIKEEMRRAEAQAQAEAVKVEEVKIVEPIKEEVKSVKVIDENSPIQDIEKAKRIEALLSKEKKVENDVIVKEVLVKEEPKVEVVKEAIKETPKQEIVKEVRVAPKRTYNEKNVDEDTKTLKQKFDAAVYKPLPERKIIQKTTTGIVRDTVKKVVVKKETPKVVTPKVEDKNNVKKTATGLVREVRKEEPKDKNPKKEIPNSKVDKKKVDDKKADKKDNSKKETANSKTDKKKSDDKKKADDKKSDKKEVKKSDKKDDKKKEATKTTKKK